MPLLFSYLFKFSVSLAVVYLFYQLVLRRLTFYQWNRFYLLGYLLLCFAIPFIHIDGWLGETDRGGNSFITIIPALGQYTAGPLAPGAAAAAVPVQAAAWGLYDWLGFVLLLGTVLMAGRLALLFLSLQRLRRKSVLITEDAQLKLYETDAVITPFSFGRSVYFNTGRHSEEELQQIMRHEYVHVQQRHTIDLLAGELLCLINWYNPFAWLMRYSIRQNLEFIADNKVLENGVDKKEYQYLLLKVVGISQYHIANNFNFSNLKKRIVMMNKMKSARLHLTRFLFVLPLLGVLLVAFRGARHTDNKPDGDYITTAGIVLDLVTKQALAGAQVMETSSGIATTTDNRGYYLLRIPVAKTTPGVRPGYHFAATLKGYDTTKSSFTPAPGKVFSGGLVEILALKSLQRDGNVMVFMPVYSKVIDGKEESDRELSYDDALQGYQAYLKQQHDIDLLLAQRDKNPQVAMFYSTEDKKKQIVFLKNGQIEKYGYPGEPTVAELENKYGQLPSFSKENTTPHTYYYKQWQDISDRLARSFKPSGDAKAIVFPGDSRVLVQSPDNKVEMYDMDYQQDRDKFEALYGRLPGLSPAGRSDIPKSAAGKPVTVVTPVYNKGIDVATDTTPAPGLRITGRKNDGRDSTIFIWKNGFAAGRQPLFIIDGREASDDKLRNIRPADIESISVLKDKEWETAKIYGSKGANGVILITTRKQSKMEVDTARIQVDTARWWPSEPVLGVSDTTENGVLRIRGL